MNDLTLAQKRAIMKFETNNQVRNAYRTASLATMNALVKKGYLRDVTPFGAGGMFSPQTHYDYVLSDKGLAAHFELNSSGEFNEQS